MGEEIEGFVLRFLDGRSKEQTVQHIRGLKSKHCPEVFEHERDYQEALEKDMELKRAELLKFPLYFRHTMQVFLEQAQVKKLFSII